MTLGIAWSEEMDANATQANPRSVDLLTISGYVAFYNNRESVREAVASLRSQDVSLTSVVAIDDGSTDGGAETVKELGVPVVTQPKNLGRGAARSWAMLKANSELVVCCDATNVLPHDFVRRLLPWFDDPKVAAVHGRIQDPNPRNVVDRWRARHLFKAGHDANVRHSAPLITYGTIVRRSAVMAVGNFDSKLRHSEDAELGERLLAAGFDVVGDPRVAVYCNVRNTVSEVLERYWRWYVGAGETYSFRAFLRSFWYSTRTMAWSDLRSGELGMALISLCVPWYQVWRRVRYSR